MQCNRADVFRQRLGDTICQRFTVWSRRFCRLQRHCLCGPGPGRAALVANGKTAEVGLDRTACQSDTFFERLTAEWQCAGCSDRAKQNRANDTARLISRCLHIETHELLGGFIRYLRHRILIDNTVTQCRFLRDGIDAVTAGNQGCHIGCDEALLNRPADFRHFTSDDQVDIAWNRIGGEHRVFANGLCPIFGKNFDAIDCGSGTLCDARDEGGLCQVTVCLCRFDQPAGENATTLPTKSKNSDSQWPLAIRRHHAILSRRLSARVCSQRITALRILHRIRSNVFGLNMTSAL